MQKRALLTGVLSLFLVATLPANSVDWSEWDILEAKDDVTIYIQYFGKTVHFKGRPFKQEGAEIRVRNRNLEAKKVRFTLEYDYKDGNDWTTGTEKISEVVSGKKWATIWDYKSPVVPRVEIRNFSVN